MNKNKFTEKRVLFQNEDFLSLVHCGKKDLRMTDINSLLSDALLFVDNVATMSDIRVHKNLSEDIPMCMLDDEQVELALLNILRNAFQAMPRGGHLTVTTSYSINDEEILISVSDTGEGIPPENLDRVLKPFFSTKKEGLGLGLTLTNCIIQQHKGRMALESIVGQGTTVFLYFPAQMKLEMFPRGFSRIGITPLQKKGRTVLPERVINFYTPDKRAAGYKGARASFVLCHRNGYTKKSYRG